MFKRKKVEIFIEICENIILFCFKFEKTNVFSLLRGFFVKIIYIFVLTFKRKQNLLFGFL